MRHQIGNDSGISQIFKMKIGWQLWHSPGQSPWLHDKLWLAGPRHSRPPLDGGGLLHNRCLPWTPCPQDFEQVVQLPQALHPPSTKEIRNSSLGRQTRQAPLMLGKSCSFNSGLNRAVFNWVSKVISELLWFCITSLSDWFKVFAPLFQPIRSETKTSRGSRVHNFPRFVSATCNYFEFWLVYWIVSVLFDWPK